MKTMILAAMLAASGAFAQTAVGKTLNERAQAARTVEDHLAVSGEYRGQVRELEARVREESVEVQRLQKKPVDAMAIKWQHARPDPLTVARERLLEAKRALQEAKDAAQHHSQVALELRLRSTDTAAAPTPPKG